MVVSNLLQGDQLDYLAIQLGSILVGFDTSVASVHTYGQQEVVLNSGWYVLRSFAVFYVIKIIYQSEEI